MDIDITSVEIPDLSGQIKLSSFKPRFNGNYSSVYQAIFQDQLVAVKVIKEIYGAQVHTIERKLKRERTTWALLRHPNILPLWGFTNDHELFEPFGALISPWRAQGNAAVFLKDRGKELTKDQRLNMWKGVIAGMQYLHDHKPVLVHGDLKLANVMIDDQYSPQICDFGLVSIILEEGHSGMTTTSLHTGTDRYLAYELIRDEDTVIPTVASDIFALGCVGLEFYFLKLPYACRQNNMQGRIFADIKAGIPPAAREPVCDSQSEAIWDLLDHCWAIDPSQRPTARELLASLQFQRDEAELPKHGIEGGKLTREMLNDNSSWPLLRAQDDFADDMADTIMGSDINSAIQGHAAAPWSTGQSQRSQFVQGGVPRDANFSRRSDAVGPVLDSARAALKAGRSLQGTASWPQDHDPVSRPGAHELSTHLEDIFAPVDIVTHLGLDPLPLAVTQSQAGIQTHTHTPEGDTGPAAVRMEIDTDRSSKQSDPNTPRDQEPETVSFVDHDVHQEILQGSRGIGQRCVTLNSTGADFPIPQKFADNTPNTIMEIDTSSGAQGSAANALTLPQTGTQSFTGPLSILSADESYVTVSSGFECTQERLKQVLGPSSPLTNEALIMLLRLIIESSFIFTNAFEPTITSHEGQALLRYVRSMPDCPIDALRDGSNSIFAVFVSYPGFRCLICGNSKESMDSGIGCVRTHLNHRPYACHEGGGCKTCPRDLVVQRFHTAALLSDHCGKKSYTSTDQALPSLPPQNLADNIMEGDMNPGIQGDAADPWSVGQSQQNQFVQGGMPGDVNFSRRADSVDNVLNTARAAHQAGGSSLGMGSLPQDHTTGFQPPTERVQAAYGTYLGISEGNGAYSNLGDDLDNRYLQQPCNGSLLNLEQGDGTGAVGAGDFKRNNSNSNPKQQGRRNEVDEKKLAEAFMPGSFRIDPALRFFLDLIRTCHFYQEDEPESLVGTPEAEQLFAQVRSLYPHDLRFAPRNDSGFSSLPLGSETRDSLSIFMLLTENNQCLICGAQRDRIGRALGHVRSDIGHRPYHCTCEKCMQSENPRRFFSDNLLDDHLKGQQVKQECAYCHSLFRRGGMKRHLISKHPEQFQSAQE